MSEIANWSNEELQENYDETIVCLGALNKLFVEIVDEIRKRGSPPDGNPEDYQDLM